MRLIKWLIGLVVCTVVLLGLTPLLTKWYLIHCLEENGYQASIKKLGIDFIFGEVSLSGVDLLSPKGEGLKLFDGQFKIDMASLFSGPLTITQATLDHFTVDIDRREGALFVAGFAESAIGQVKDGDWQVRVNGLSLKNVGVCRIGRKECVQLESGSISRIQIAYDQHWRFEHAGPVRIEKLFLLDPSTATSLVYAGHVHLDSSRWDHERVSLTGFTLGNFQFIDSAAVASSTDARFQTQLGEMKLSSLFWQQGAQPQLHFGDVDVTSLRQEVRRSVKYDGDSAVQRIAFWLPSLMSLVGQYKHPTQQPLDLQVGEVNLRDGALSWMDAGVTPVVSESFSAAQLYVSAMSSQAPEQSSAVRLVAKVGREGLLKLEGQYFPFASKMEFHFDGLLQNLQLENISGYTKGWFKQAIFSGVADVGFDLTARQGNLDGNTQWRLTQMQVERSARGGYAVPLELAIKVLQDHNQSVPFDMPIRGSFERGDLTLEKVFGGSMRQRLSDLASKQVGSAGPVALASRQSGKPAMTFEPLLYSTNTRVLDDADKSRLDEFVKLLKDKPHLSMVFCPIATGGEWAELFNKGAPPDDAVEILDEERQVLLDLAASRSRMLRAALLELGIDDRQIVLCPASVDLKLAGRSFITVTL